MAKLSNNTWGTATPTPTMLLLVSILCAATFLTTYTTARPLSSRQLRGSPKDNLVEVSSELFHISEGEELAVKKPRAPPNNTYWDEHALPVVQLTLGAPYVKPSPGPRSWLLDLTPQPASTSATATATAAAAAATTAASSTGSSSKEVNISENAGAWKANNATAQKQIWPPRNVTVIYAKTSDTVGAGKSDKSDNKSDNSDDEPSRKLSGWNVHEVISNANRKLLAGGSSSGSLPSTAGSSNSVYTPKAVHVFLAKNSTAPAVQASTGTADVQVSKPQQTALDTIAHGVIRNSDRKIVDNGTVSLQEPACMTKHDAKVFVANNLEGNAASSSSSNNGSSSKDRRVVHMFAAKELRS